MLISTRGTLIIATCTKVEKSKESNPRKWCPGKSYQTRVHQVVKKGRIQCGSYIESTGFTNAWVAMMWIGKSGIYPEHMGGPFK